MPFNPTDAGAVFVQLAVQDNVEVLSLAILYYDYILTFDLELERFWQRPKLSLVSFLFYLNRYGVLLGYIPTLVILIRPDFLLRGNACYIYQRVFVDYRLAFTHSVIAVILVVRTSALYMNNRRVVVFLVLIVIGMITNGVMLWLKMDKSNEIHAQENLCINIFNKLQGTQLAGMWAGLFILDFAVFTLTLRKTLMLVRDCPDSVTLWSAMMRDGAVYFGVLAFTNLFNIFLLLFAPTALKTLMTDFINVLASSLISRLMLNLRDKSLTRFRGQVTTKAISAPIQFAPRKVISNTSSAHSSDSDLELGMK